MAEMGHAEDCPGCNWRSLHDEDRRWLTDHGGETPKHTRLAPPKDRDGVAFSTWRAEQIEVWKARRAINYAWPCPWCGHVLCVVCMTHHGHYQPSDPIVETRELRDQRLFGRMFS